MKRLRKLIVILMSLSLTSCGFVNYVEASSSMEQTVVVDEITTKRNEYIQKLDETYLEENYEGEEKAQLRRCLIEAKAELRECNSMAELQETFDKNKEIINAIKTKAQYAKELADKKEEYVAKIKSISDESKYRGDEKDTFYFYVDKAIEAINGIESIKEDFEKIYNAYKNIIEAIKTDADYVKEELAAFEKYKQDAINEINNYLDINEYREAEAKAIKELADTAVNNIKESEEHKDIDALVRKYKTDVYQYETDEQLYGKELASLIDESKRGLSSYVNVTNYRDNEIKIINTLLDAFSNEVDGLGIKEEVIKLLNTYKGLLDAIKTNAQLYEEEKHILIDNLFQELKTVVDYDNLSETEKGYYDDFYETLLLLSKKEEVELSVTNEKAKVYKDRAINGDSEALIQYQLYLVDSLNYYLDKSLYRTAQQEEIDSIITASYGPILSCSNYNDTIDALNDRKSVLNAVLTNDEMWEIEDEAFFTTLHSLYGDDILIPEGSLTEANDYYELAKIIDYYAFYQLDANSFVRDMFRVKLNFEAGTLSTIISKMVNEYCELAKYSVGIRGSLESNYLIITLVPYDFGEERYESTSEFHPLTNNIVFISDNGSTFIDRSNDFDEFNYYNYDNVIKIWNSQQLWYALEHGYVPDCKVGSVAEYVLEQCKAVLRIINKDGMTEKEKIFNIYTWIGTNFAYANGVTITDNSITQYPEGAFLDHYLVCRGFAKLYLILLRLEGIKAYLTFRYSSSHESILIDIDGLYYMSDVTFATYVNRNNLTYKYLLIENPLDNVLYADVNYASSHSDIYNFLTINNNKVLVNSNEEMMDLVDSFLLNGDYYSCLNVLFDSTVSLDFSLIPNNLTIDGVRDYFIGSYSMNEIVIKYYMV